MLHLSGFLEGVVQNKKREHQSFYATFQIFHFETPVSGSPVYYGDIVRNDLVKAKVSIEMIGLCKRGMCKQAN